MRTCMAMKQKTLFLIPSTAVYPSESLSIFLSYLLYQSLAFVHTNAIFLNIPFISKSKCKIWYMWGKEFQEAFFLFSRNTIYAGVWHSLQEEKKEKKYLINLITSIQGKRKFSDIHRKLSSVHQHKLQVLHTELVSLILYSAQFPALSFP